MPRQRSPNRGGGIVGTFPSLKLNRNVPFESTIERDLCYLLDFDRQVVTYQEQPFQISEVDATGQMRHYTPDFLVHHRDGSCALIECKPADRLEHPHTVQQLTLGRAYAARHGYTFAIMTDTTLRQGHELATIKLLWRYRKTVVPSVFQRTVVTTLATCPAGCALQMFGSPATYHYVYALLFHGVVQTDLDHPLTPSSLIWWSEEED